MSWVVFALLAVVCNAAKNIATRSVGSGVDVYTVALVSNIVMLPVLWGSVLISDSWVVQPAFWQLMFVMLPFELLVMYLFFTALTSSRLSRSFPFVSFMPIFVALGSYFILDEQLSIWVYLGMLIIVAGAFLLNSKGGLTTVDTRGVVFILGVAALWGYLIPMGSLAVEYSSAELYPAIYFSLATLLFVPLYLLKRTSRLGVVRVHARAFIFIGIAFALFTIFNWQAYAIGPTTAISALAMLAIPVTSFLDSLYHREPLTTWHIIATILMTVGAVVVVVG